MMFKSKEEVEAIRAVYQPGVRIRLIHMEGEPNMPEGMEGIVDEVDDTGQIHMNWANGSGLAIHLDIDSFEII